MNARVALTPEVQLLIEAVCDGMADDIQMYNLKPLLLTDEAARIFYVDLLNLNAELHWLVGSLEEGKAAFKRFAVPKQIPPQRSLPAFINTALHSSLTSGWPLAYMISAVLIGIGLLFGSFFYISHQQQVVNDSNIRSSLAVIHASVVARVTGMADCEFANPSSITFDGAYVRLGRKYAISSGLMEITYDTGTKVILQGPATYEVKSANSGYLSLGKLTALMEEEEKEGEIREKVRSNEVGIKTRPRNSEVSAAAGTAFGPKSTMAKLLFCVTTPSAVVTDLGTEFGVEVDKCGNTRSHVFRGLIRVDGISVDGSTVVESRALHENESAYVKKSGDGGEIVVESGKTAIFVRQIPKRKMRTLDLVDMVAGGDGLLARRNSGINPATGAVTTILPDKNGVLLSGDGRYHRIESLPFVDGVFIPWGGSGRSVQLDSAGHTFAGFPATNNKSWSYIWAGGAWQWMSLPNKNNPGMPPMSGKLQAGFDYSMPWHSMLGMFANKGITFNLDAVRRVHPQCKIERFRAAVGNTCMPDLPEEPWTGKFDVWVFVDGQVRYRREGITGRVDELKIDVKLEDTSRFLSLVVTDGGDTFYHDQVIFGDPKLLVSQTSMERHDQSEPQ